jgi:hypothetical protein
MRFNILAGLAERNMKVGTGREIKSNLSTPNVLTIYMNAGVFAARYQVIWSSRLNCTVFDDASRPSR